MMDDNEDEIKWDYLYNEEGLINAIERLEKLGYSSKEAEEIIEIWDAENA